MTKKTLSKVRQKFKDNTKRFIAAKASKAKGGGSAFSKSVASSNPNRPDPSGGKTGSQFRTKATINRLNMYTAKPNLLKMRERPTDPNAGKI